MINGYPIDHPTGNMGYTDQHMYTFRDKRLYMTVLYDGFNFINADSTRSVLIETREGGNCMPGAPNVTESNSTRTGYFLRKWLDTETSLIEGQTQGSHYYNVIFRKGELFLNFAEAAYYAYGWEDANLGFTAKQALQEVRRRAGIIGDGFIDEVSGDEIIELIKNERRIELCFEGHRFWDLRRWKENLNEPIQGVEINKIGTISRRTLLTPVYKDYMYYLPIPNDEILKTEKIVQNAGW